MDPGVRFEDPDSFSTTGTLAFAILTLYGLHSALVYFDVPILSPRELLWNALVYCIPTSILLSPARRSELRGNGMLAQTRAAKGEELRRILGLGGNAILQKLPTAGNAIGIGGVMRRMSAIGTRPTIPTTDAPPGLGNWDNSCYQNSVLQALASLTSLQEWLKASRFGDINDGPTTNSVLQETISKLLNPANNGRQLWTPPKLKNMSSWQQQDAQEYFSKILDELDKEAAKAFVSKEAKPGLESLLSEEPDKDEPAIESKTTSRKVEMGFPEETTVRNPLEGLAAQRVVCTTCGFSEGLSMIPFNCLTVPLGSSLSYDLDDCLDEYTKREAIEGVECRRCTLLHAEERLKQLVLTPPKDIQVPKIDHEHQTINLPPEIRCQVVERLQAIQEALDQDDYSDKTLKQTCQIPAKAYISSTKVREASIGRAPKTLVIHVNRSVFDEMTGAQRKNHAHVRYPFNLDLNPWMLEMTKSPINYTLRAVITHYGRHENGHYICYRQHSVHEIEDDLDSNQKGPSKQRWWCLSDEDVSSVTETEVLGLAGAFMLFYERDEFDEPTLTAVEDVAQAAAVPLPADELDDFPSSLSADHAGESSPLITPVQDLSMSHSTASESDNDTETLVEEDVAWHKNVYPQAPIMRTAPPSNVWHQIDVSRSIMSA